MSKFYRLSGTIIFWVTWPALYLLLNNSHRVRVIINVDDKVVFVRDWIGEDKLSLPGGGVKRGEKPEQAVVREVYEETGIKLNVKDLILVTENLYMSEKGIKAKINCYKTTLSSTLSTKSDSLEIIESVWVSWKEKIDSRYFSKNTNKLLHIWLS